MSKHRIAMYVDKDTGTMTIGKLKKYYKAKDINIDEDLRREFGLDDFDMMILKHIKDRFGFYTEIASELKIHDIKKVKKTLNRLHQKGLAYCTEKISNNFTFRG
ncbi:MAG: hypothetical protein ACOC7U_00905 [Spirochaetota bacterium]